MLTVLLGYFSLVVIVLLLASAILQALDILLDPTDRTAFRTWVVNFWISTADLHLYDQLHRALQSRYNRMRSLRFRFLQLFWFLAVAVIFTAAVEVLWLSTPKEVADSYRQVLSFDFSQRYFVYFRYLLVNKEDYFVTTDMLCLPIKDFKWLSRLTDYRRSEQAFQGLVSELEEHSPALLLTSAIVTHLIDVVILLIPLSLALWVSFRLTLWLLSTITGSYMRLVFILTADLIVAIIMPPLLTSMMLVLLVAVGVFAFGQVLDFTVFQSANWVSLTLGASLLILNGILLIPAVLALIVYVMPLSVMPIVAPLVFLLAIALMVYNRVLGFVTESAKFLRFDLSTDVINSVVDWAIFADLLFSLGYLLPCLALILANRSPFTRKLFLNLVQWVADHKRGPIIAMSEILTSFATYIRRLFSGS